MKQILSLFIYYFTLLLGLIFASWIIWTRFIRERTIRDIPDSLFTEYRFWILLYICIIYLYVIKNLIRPKNQNIVLKEFFEILYMPLKTLDHAIKYNKYFKPYYNKLMLKIIPYTFTDTISHNMYVGIIFSLQILPRIFLISFLLLDTFYFQKLELFYKIILIGLLPFILNYIKYSIKDFYEFLIKNLEEYYEYVVIYEEGYKLDKNRIGNTAAIYHNQKKTIREYIDIKFENMAYYYTDEITYEYNAYPAWKDSIEEKYFYETYGYTTLDEISRNFGYKGIKFLQKLYYELMPKIIKLKLTIYTIDLIGRESWLKYIQIIIFSLYLICWGYILIISYWYYPVTLSAGSYFIYNFSKYLLRIEDPFGKINGGSLNKNLITIEALKEKYKICIKYLKNSIMKWKWK